VKTGRKEDIFTIYMMTFLPSQDAWKLSIVLNTTVPGISASLPFLSLVFL